MLPSSRRQRRRRSLCLFASLWVLFSAGTTIAQDDAPDPAKAKGRVIGRLWHSQVNSMSMMSYVQNVGKEIGLPQSPIMMFAGGMGTGASILGNAQQAELKGTLVFLETFPSAGTPRFISFRKVQDLDEFQKLVRQESQRLGPMGELLGDDDRFEVKMNLRRIPMAINGGAPDASPEDGEPQQFSIQIRSEVRLGDGPEETGEPPELPDSISTFYRYHDGVMYSGQMEALHFIDLPSADSMLPAEKFDGTDIHGVFDLAEVPRHLKQALWASLKAETETYMQRFDNEARGDHALRSVLGQGRLELLKAAMFDVDKAEFSVRFPAAEETAIQAGVEIEARKGSRLAQTLLQLNKTPSRLGVLREDSSPLVFSTTLDLPEWAQPIATGFVTSLRTRMQEAADDATLEQAITDLFAPILAATSASDLDAAVRMEGDFESGMVLTGGVRLPDAEQFQATLETLLLLKSGDGLSVGRTALGDANAIQISLDRVQPSFAETAVPVDIFLVGKGSYLWFAAGGSNTADVLQAQLAEEPKVLDAQVRAMPLMVRMKLSQWFGEGQTGVSRLPSQMVDALERSMADMLSPMFKMAVMVNGSSIQPEKPKFTGYARKLLKEDAGDFELRLETMGRSLALNAEVGTGVAQFLVAQYAAAQNRMFSNLKFNFEGGEIKGGAVRSIRIGN